MHITKIIAATALAAVATSAAFATTTVATPGTGQRSIAIAYGGPIGQSFTATDTDLSSFGFQFEALNPTYANTPVTLSILNGSGLGGSVLTSVTATLPASILDRTPTWYDFDLTGTTLTAGQSYTAILTTASLKLALVYGPDINIYTGQPLGGDAYAGGQIFASVPLDGICTGSGSICDANFRFTATTPAAVPEPASWAMMVGGFGLLGGALRRRALQVRFA